MLDSINQMCGIKSLYVPHNTNINNLELQGELNSDYYVSKQITLLTKRASK